MLIPHLVALTPIWANTNMPGAFGTGCGAPQAAHFAGFNSDITPGYDNQLGYWIPDVGDDVINNCNGVARKAAEIGNTHIVPYPSPYNDSPPGKHGPGAWVIDGPAPKAIPRKKYCVDYGC